MDEVQSSSPRFSDHLNWTGEVRGGRAFFGTNVLAGLVEGLREALVPPRTERSWGPGVLGCAMWMDDPELIDVLARMSNLCIVVTKQRAKDLSRPKADRVKQLAADTGLLQSAFPELGDLAAKVDGRAMVVGPGTGDWTEEQLIPGVREVGYRKTGGQFVPIVHAKILLLGRMLWTDELPSGHLVDEHFFVPERLWIGSANFTTSSRSSLEMGLWTEDPDLLGVARRFLLGLVGLSEPLGLGPDLPAPELVPVEYDDAAFFEYMAEMRADHLADDADE